MDDQAIKPRLRLFTIGDWEIHYRRDAIKRQLFFGIIAIICFALAFYLIKTSSGEETLPQKPMYAVSPLQYLSGLS